MFCTIIQNLVFAARFFWNQSPSNWHTKSFEGTATVSLFLRPTIHPCRLPASTPQGRDIPAQGNALGSGFPPWAKPWKGVTSLCSIQEVPFTVVCATLPEKFASSSKEVLYVTPFQGFCFSGDLRPRALPWAGMSRPCGVDSNIADRSPMPFCIPFRAVHRHGKLEGIASNLLLKNRLWTSVHPKISVCSVVKKIGLWAPAHKR